MTGCLHAKENIKITVRDTVVGTNLKSGEPIKALIHITPNRIDDYKFNEKNNRVTLQLGGLSRNGKWLKNTGSYLVYDLTEKKVKWALRMDFLQTSMQYAGEALLYSYQGRTSLVDQESGMAEWDVKNALYYVNSESNIGIGYRYKSAIGTTNILQGIKMEDGKELWSRNLDRTYSWNETITLNDSMVIVSAAGLHLINLNTGKGCDYNAITGHKDYTATAIANAAGVASGLLTGNFLISTGHNLVRDAVSNVLMDSTFLYFASKNKIAKLTTDGEVIWQQALPNDISGKSILYLQGDNLYMLSLGYAYMGYRQLSYGEPFVAVFDSKVGKMKFLDKLSQSDGFITSSRMTPSGLYVYQDRKIISYNLSWRKKTWATYTNNGTSTRHLIGFANPNMYMKQNNNFLAINQDTTSLYLISNDGNIIKTNKNLELEATYSEKERYVQFAVKDEFTFYKGLDNVMVTNQSGNIVLEILINGNTELVGKSLYNVVQNSLTEINLNEHVKD